MRRLGWRLVFSGLLLGCGTDPPSSVPCPKPTAAFEVVIRRAERGALPRDTKVRLLYAGNLEETYEVEKPAVLQTLFCREADWDGDRLGGQALGQGGAAGSGNVPEGLACEVWVEAPATLEVEATGYEATRLELELELDRCGHPRTVEERIELEALDGGVDAG